MQGRDTPVADQWECELEQAISRKDQPMMCEEPKRYPDPPPGLMSPVLASHPSESTLSSMHDAAYVCGFLGAKTLQAIERWL